MYQRRYSDLSCIGESQRVVPQIIFCVYYYYNICNTLFYIATKMAHFP